MRKLLQVMKFGAPRPGMRPAAQELETVGDAWRKSSVAVVVSAMSGVTKRLIEAAN